MTQSLPDDARLRAAEAQMRRALGLAAGTQRDPRPFIRRVRPMDRIDNGIGSFVMGMFRVFFLRRNHKPDRETGTNKRDATRQAMRFHLRPENFRAVVV